jgi:hypothetical protein
MPATQRQGVTSSSRLSRATGQVSCLSEPGKQVTPGAGKEKKNEVTLDASKVKQPGVLNANLVIHQNTPHDFGYVPVALMVQ